MELKNIRKLHRHLLGDQLVDAIMSYCAEYDIELEAMVIDIGDDAEGNNCFILGTQFIQDEGVE
jgi:hypothetical protein